MATSSNQLVQTPLCTFCKEEKITEWICSDCDKPLCYECKRCHLWDFRRMDHKIVRVVPLEGKDHNIVRAVPLENSANEKQILKKVNCKEHKDHYCTNYCIECRCLVCPECVSVLSVHSRHTFKTINTIHEETLKKLGSKEIHIKQNLLPSITRKLKSLKDWSTFREEKFEEEKEKILKQADDLKKWITEFSDDLVNELKQILVKNAEIISQQKVKLEQLQKELKEKIKFINDSTVKDDIEQILNDVSNASINIKHLDIPLFIPKETKRFSVEKFSEESIISIFGTLKNYDQTADVECKIIKSYNLPCFIMFMDQVYYHISVAIASDETISIANINKEIELKPDKRPKLIVYEDIITDILFLETNELVFATRDSVKFKNEHDEIQTLFTLPKMEQSVLALCRNRDGNIIILYTECFHNFLGIILPRNMSRKCYIEVISGNGDPVKRILCEEQFLLLFRRLNDRITFETFKMTENMNKDIVILSMPDNVKAIGQDGKLKWQQEFAQPVDVKSTPLGSIIVLCKSGCLFILNSDGKFVKKINIEGASWLYPTFCFKSDKELAIVDGEELKIYIAQFSFVV